MRELGFILLMFLVSCTSKKSEEVVDVSILKETKSLDKLRKELLIKLSNEYYPEFDFSNHNFISDTMSNIFATYSDSIDSNYYNCLDGPLIAFYKNGEPELLRMFKDNDYYDWEYWFDSTGLLEEIKLRFPKPLGDNGKIQMYREFDKKGNATKESYVKINGGKNILYLKRNSENVLQLEWGYDKSDSLTISYKLYSDIDTTEYKHLGSFTSADSQFVLSGLDTVVRKIKFQTNAYYSKEGSYPAYISKEVIFN